MGSGLKPVYKPACPKCDFVLKYYVRDPQANPSNWVMTEESIDHLGVAHNEIDQEVRKVRRGTILHRFRKRNRFPAHRRIDAVSGSGRK